MKKDKIKKKHHIFLKILIIFLVIFIVIPVVLVFGFIYCTDTKEVPNNPTNFTEIISNTLTDGLDYEEIKEENRIKFSINNELIDQGLMYVCNNMGEEVNKFIPKLYCNINENNYDFFVEVQASFFKTRLILRTSLDSNEENILHFKINGITLGRLPIPNGLTSMIATKFISDEQINSTFESAGIGMKCSLANMEINYPRESFISDISKKLDNKGNNPFASIITSLMGNGNDGVFNFDFNNGINGYFNFLSDDVNLVYDPKYEKSKPENHFLNTIKMNDIAEIMSNAPTGLITEDNASTIFNFLFRGDYDSLSSEKQDIINLANTNDFIINAIRNKLGESTDSLQSYDGVVVRDTERFNEVITPHALEIQYDEPTPIPPTPGDYDIVTLTDENLSKYFSGFNDLIGTGTVMLSKHDNKTEVNYIVIDNFFTDFTKGKSSDNKDELNLYFSCSINGYPITVIIPTTLEFINRSEIVEPSDNLIAQLKVKINSDKIELGTLKLDNDSINGLLETMGDSMGEDSIISYNKDNKEFVMDIESPTKIPSQLLTPYQNLSSKVNPATTPAGSSSYVITATVEI